MSFYDGTTLLASPTLASGQATFTATSLTPGTHNISVSYAGDSGYFLSYSTTITQTVGVADTTVSAPISSGPTTFGDPVTFTATVAAAAPGSGTPTGTVTFYDGATSIGTGTLDGSGMAALTLSTLAAGTHPVTASYGGDADFAASTSATATSQAVSQLGTTTALATSPVAPANLAFGQPVTLTATVAPVAGSATPTGTVTFYDGDISHPLGTGTLDGSGVATLITGSLGFGSHTIFAGYGGDTDFVASTSTSASFTVTLASATIVVSSTTNPGVSDQSVVLEVTVSPPYEGAATPMGTVTFYNGATSIGTGTLDGTGSYTLTVPGAAVRLVLDHGLLWRRRGLSGRHVIGDVARDRGGDDRDDRADHRPVGVRPAGDVHGERRLG